MVKWHVSVSILWLGHKMWSHVMWLAVKSFIFIPSHPHESQWLFTSLSVLPPELNHARWGPCSLNPGVRTTPCKGPAHTCKMRKKWPLSAPEIWRVVAMAVYQADLDLYRSGRQKWRGQAVLKKAKAYRCGTDLVDGGWVKDTSPEAGRVTIHAKLCGNSWWICCLW